MNEQSSPSKQNGGPPRLGLIDRYLPASGADDRMEGAAPVILSVATLRGILWRQKAVLGGVTLAVLLLGLVYTLLATPIYQATATLRVNTEGGQIVEGQELIEPYIHPNQINNYLATLGAVIRSRSMALRVADKVDATSALDGAPGDASQAARDAEAELLQSRVEVEIPYDSQIISIHYRASDRNQAADIANAYAEGFLADSIERSVDANSYAREYLEGEIEEVQGQLRDAEMRAIDYARANRLIAAGGGAADSETPATGSVAQNELGGISQAFTQARAARIGAEQRWRAIASVPAGQLPEVQQNSSIQALRTELARRESELADLQERYLQDYPAVREAGAEIAALENRIASASAEVKSGIRREYEIARRQEAGLAAEMGRVSDASLREQDRRVQYNLIDREVSSLRGQLAALRERYNQIASAANLRSSNVTLLDAATVPQTPVSPNLLRNLLTALVLGLGLALVIAILRELFDDRLRSTDEIEAKLGIPALGQTPYVPGDVAEELADPFSPVSEAYSSIRATLDYATRTGEQQVIQFTSSSDSEGKTTTCVAVARKYASVGKRVLLLDMDLRRPAIHRHFAGARPKVGVVDVIFGRVPLADALIPGGTEGLDVLPVGEVPGNPVETLSSGLVAEFLERLRSEYDVIVVDASPVMGIADSPLLSRFVDGVIFVVEANGVHSRAARSAIRRLQDMKAHILGGIVTKYRALEAGQDKAYQYRHYSYNAEKA